MRKETIIWHVLLLLVWCSRTAAQQNFVLLEANETESERITKAARVVPAPRQLRWQQLELTAFFHFGINTFTNREWGDGKENPALFNPTAFDATQWMAAAKAAGIKQVILTAKHHDGFCLWPSKYTKHSVAASPWQNGKGDVVKEVAKAAKDAGLGFGVYLSPWDRNSPLYGTEAYNEYFANQLTELLTQYGRIDEVWFDGANGEGPNGKKQVYDFNRWYALIRKLQPQAVIAIMGPDVRWVGTETGHGRETEWSVVPANHMDEATVAALSQQDLAFKPMGDMMGTDLGSRAKIADARALVWYPAETDVSIRPGWFYHAEEDDKVKTAVQLLDIYFNSVGRNGVLLINLPPDKRGRLHENDVAILKAWKKTRDSIFHQNLAKLAGTNIPSANILFDGNDATDIPFSEKDSTIIPLDFASPVTCNVLAMQENIRHGQRIEAFVLQYEHNNTWHTVASGSTVGYKRLVSFKTVRATQFRIIITQARDTIHLAEMGLYFNPMPTP